MPGIHTFHSIFSLVMYVSIVDLALFCLDLPLPKRLRDRQAQKKYQRQRHTIGKKSQDKKNASSRIPSHPRLFVGPAHLSFKIKYSLRDLVFCLIVYCFLIRCNLSCTKCVPVLIIIKNADYLNDFVIQHHAVIFML